MEIYKNKFITITSSNDTSRIDFVWTAETESLDDDGFRHALREQTKAIQATKPTSVYLDTLLFVFPILPETQEWVDAEIYPAWAEAGITKIAIVMSTEILAQMSIEQAFEENTQEVMSSRFFDDGSTAQEWLVA